MRHPQRVVISMTSIKSREGTLGPTLRSLAEQTRTPDEIRIYLAPDVVGPTDPSITIYRTTDHGPVTKISAVFDPDLQKDPSVIVVTVDDDQIYQRVWLETLLEGAAAHPDSVVGFAGWNVKGFLEDPINGTYHWAKAPSACDVIEGWSGVAYRPRLLAGITDLFDPPEPFRWVDDVWISANLHWRGVERFSLHIPMSRENVSRSDGLHHRRDFVELNRQASILAFSSPRSRNACQAHAAPVPTLSLAICSLFGADHDRTLTFTELLTCLQQQPGIDEVEILTIGDTGRETVGDKRNRLKTLAQGRYFAFIDDDDLVAPDYIAKVLDAIRREPEADVVLIRGCRTDPDGNRVEYDYRLNGQEGEWINGVIWRSPGHLCPIRRDLAIQHRFPATVVGGEDLAWNGAMAPLLKRAVRAGEPGEVLYHYRWDPNKVTPREREKRYLLRLRESLKPSLEVPVSTPSIPTPPVEPSPHADVFTPQYTERSGPGSTPAYSAPYRAFLEAFLREHKIKSVIDLGCGDLEVMSRVDLQGAKYLGVDVIKERIERNTKAHPHLQFECRDVHVWPFPAADLILCKDVIQHWSTLDAAKWLRLLDQRKPFFRFALLTNCNYGPTVNTDIKTGGWRAIDLLRPPFSVGTLGKVVFHWETKDVVLVRGEAVRDLP